MEPVSTQLPTDNLYKFLALSGVALVLASLCLCYQRVSQLQLLVAEAKGDEWMMNEETNIWNADNGFLQSDVDDLTSRMQEWSKRLPSTNSATWSEMDRIDAERLDALSDKLRDTRDRLRGEHLQTLVRRLEIVKKLDLEGL